MPIHSTAADHVWTISIDRQERRNALDLASLQEFDAAVTRAHSEGARALVVTGAGGHFCAGADLSELKDVSFTDTLAEILQRFAALPIVTVAAISGSCMGLGMQLALASDLRVASSDARFSVPVARLGLMVDHWTLDRLRRYFGEGAARHMVLTGAVLTAEDAWRLGFVQHQGYLADAVELAGRAATLAPLTQAGSKLGFDISPDLPDHAQTRYDAAFTAAWSSDDLREGQQAFLQRRSASFVGR